MFCRTSNLSLRASCGDHRGSTTPSASSRFHLTRKVSSTQNLLPHTSLPLSSSSLSSSCSSLSSSSSSLSSSSSFCNSSTHVGHTSPSLLSLSSSPYYTSLTRILHNHRWTSHISNSTSQHSSSMGSTVTTNTTNTLQIHTSPLPPPPRSAHTVPPPPPLPLCSSMFNSMSLSTSHIKGTEGGMRSSPDCTTRLSEVHQHHQEYQHADSSGSLDYYCSSISSSSSSFSASALASSSDSLSPSSSSPSRARSGVICRSSTADGHKLNLRGGCRRSILVRHSMSLCVSSSRATPVEGGGDSSGAGSGGVRGGIGSCKVLVRLRPESLAEISSDPGGSLCTFITQENKKKKKLQSQDVDDGSTSSSSCADTIAVHDNSKVYRFNFERVLDQNTSQEELYTELCHGLEFSTTTTTGKAEITEKQTSEEEDRLSSSGGGSLVTALLSGYSASIIAYGQTGAGKTYSMMGGMSNQTVGGGGGGDIECVDPISRGIIPRLMDELLEQTKSHSNADCQFSLRASFIEIYNEKVRDLVCPSKDNLKIRESTDSGLLLTEATEVPIKNMTELLGVLEAGTKQRVKASTKSNEHSSRSHAIFLLNVHKKSMSQCTVKPSQLYLVDLAGSEKISKSNVEGDRLREAQNINLSLLALGNVIQVLSSNTTTNPHVPYRDSKLTRVLQNSFGGSAYTLVLLCCSPHSYNARESINTLRFGDRANKVRNRPAPQVSVNVEELQRQLVQAQQTVRQHEARLRQLSTHSARQELCIQNLLKSVPQVSELSQQDQSLLNSVMGNSIEETDKKESVNTAQLADYTSDRCQTSMP
eukprot:GHVQ01036533.1.p1 GENE.GHVQ01036533.1~~GHVQ01036533.1.p1  ORF type:complete len:814 (+),score=172.54 GHVQ01036533.1:635-3076(+)